MTGGAIMCKRRYYKPCLTNLDPELFQSIVNTMKETPKQDWEARRCEAEEDLRLIRESSEYEQSAQETSSDI